MGFLLRRGRGVRPDTGPHSRWFAVLFFLVLFLLLGGLYATGYALTNDRVPRDVSVAGIDIGGLSPAAARQKLADDLRSRSLEPIVVTHGGRSYEIDPSEAGLTLDVAATVAATGGGQAWNPLRMVEVLTGGEDVAPVVEVDSDALDRAVAAVARKVEREPVGGEVIFAKGRAKPVYPTPGTSLDRARTAEAVTATFLDEERTLALPVEQVPADLTEDDVDTAMAEFAEPAMSGPVVVKVPGRSVTVSPRQISAALTMEPQDGELVPRLDRQKLFRSAQQTLDELTRDARPARVVLRDGGPEVVPGENGTRIDRSRFARRVLPLLSRTGNAKRTIRLETMTAKPEFDTRDAGELGIDEVVSDFTTSYPDSDYRNTNLGRAAEKINGTVLKPGEIFSLNGVVGERTAANGFKEGYIISDGVLVKDFGGGVSQVATTTYNAAFFAGLEDIEHHPHSLYFDRYPMGREATVAWGALDLRFQNNTPYGVLVQAWIEPSTPSSDGAMHVRMWSTEYWQVEAGLSDQYDFTQPEVVYNTDEDCVEQTGFPGFEVDVYRYLSRGGEEVRTETEHVTYDAANTIYCRPEPRPEPAAGSSGG